VCASCDRFAAAFAQIAPVAATAALVESSEAKSAFFEVRQVLVTVADERILSPLTNPERVASRARRLPVAGIGGGAGVRRAAAG